MRSYIVFIMLLLGMNMNVMAQSETLHIVKRGESFALIAKRYGMTEEELKAANPDYSVCYMGLKLNIPEKYAKAFRLLQLHLLSLYQDCQPVIVKKILQSLRLLLQNKRRKKETFGRSWET